MRASDPILSVGCSLPATRGMNSRRSGDQLDRFDRYLGLENKFSL